MRLQVKYLGPARELSGHSLEMVDLCSPACLEDLVRELTHRYGERFARAVSDLSRINVLLNGHSVLFLQGWHTPLADGDVIAFVVPVAGGYC